MVEFCVANYELHCLVMYHEKGYAKKAFEVQNWQGEVGQKGKTSSALLAKQTFPLSLHFPLSPKRS